jgi:hypothetical protein
VNRLRWSPRLGGHRQIGRSIHFLVACAWMAFLAVHVTLVAISAPARAMNRVVLGTDDDGRLGMVLGAVGVAAVVLGSALANAWSRRRPRAVQRATDAILDPLLAVTLDRLAPAAEYRKEDVSPFFWPNGEMPRSEA